jgi:hypothetical protein
MASSIEMTVVRFMVFSERLRLGARYWGDKIILCRGVPELRFAQ